MADFLIHFVDISVVQKKYMLPSSKQEYPSVLKVGNRNKKVKFNSSIKAFYC